jgi:2-polyprenyl-3-methyl-5-hydroxy-6-metoxy-1,4-benzoquinol methylase
VIVNEHDRELARGFDSQAAKFERAPVQSDQAAIGRLIRQADLRPEGLVLDSGCGPGLVAGALLDAGFRVVGVDLSGEMIERARRRCAGHGPRATFLQASVFDETLEQFGPFDAALSRFVLHHVIDPAAFIARQVGLLGSGGVLVVSDHITDPSRERAQHHTAIEVARDSTHTRSLTGGELVDLLAGAGLSRISLVEDCFTQDFDEWFDRGTHLDTRSAVRERFLAGPVIRSFRPHLSEDGSIRIDGVLAIIRGVKV